VQSSNSTIAGPPNDHLIPTPGASANFHHQRGLYPLPRTEVVSKMWEYIKSNNLQNPENKREILADAKLQAVFGGKSKVSMFEMNKHFAQHLS
jgi:chromatin remodeling complex protein RSC6